MKIQQINDVLIITGLTELGAANAQAFREAACAALGTGLQTIEIDLAQAGFVDSCGLGALVSLHKVASQQNENGTVTVRLLNPTPSVQQVFELTRMHHVFEIVQRETPGRETRTQPMTKPAAAA